MTQEEKQLLLKDLCARLPYEVKCAAVTTNNEPNTIGGYCEVFDYIREVGGWFNISMIKPYLRPMSSMTEEEDEELKHVIELELQALASGGGHNTVNAAPAAFEIDFYNKHHFDYRGLIPMGLALEATDGMYK